MRMRAQASLEQLPLLGMTEIRFCGFLPDRLTWYIYLYLFVVSNGVGPDECLHR